MKKAIGLLTVIILLYAACGCVDKSPPPRVEKETPQDRMEQHLTVFTGQDMAGRRAGSRGEARAALYLAQCLQQAGLKPAGDAGTYMQSFPIGKYEPVEEEKRMVLRAGTGTEQEFSANVLGLLPGIEERFIIVSAHYDHLGVIHDEVYPGANDNASGTALVLELAAALSGETPRCGIIFAFWGAEEMGLLGSSYYNAHPAVPPEKVLCVINIDSVGNLGLDNKLLGWSGTLNETSRYIVEVLNGEGWQIDWQSPGQHNSDHASFAASGISALTLLSPYWLDDNHTPRDTAEHINMGSLSDLLAALKIALAS